MPELSGDNQRFTDRPTGALLKRLQIHLQSCWMCQQAVKTRGQVKACITGYHISVEWLERRASEGDKSAQLWIAGLEQQSKVT